MDDPVAVTRKALQAYVDSDRAALEAVIADDFHFTSPLDNRLDRTTYFARCWPNHERLKGIEYLHTVADGERVWVLYEAITPDKRSRNTEVYTVRDGRLTEALVFFGWAVPHPAREGGFVATEEEDERQR